MRLCSGSQCYCASAAPEPSPSPVSGTRRARISRHDRLYLSDMTAPAEYIVLFYEAFSQDPLTRIGSE